MVGPSGYLTPIAGKKKEGKKEGKRRRREEKREGTRERQEGEKEGLGAGGESDLNQPLKRKRSERKKR